MATRRQEIESPTDIAAYYVTQLESLFCAASRDDRQEISAKVADLNARLMAAAIDSGRFGL